jgi:flagellar biosynthesis protein FliQ
VELLTDHLGRGLMLALLLSLPVVLVAAMVGLVVGILQAVTQVQEQTIAAAPKILAVFATLLLGGGLMMSSLEDYVRETFQVAFNEIPQDGVFVMPPRLLGPSKAARAQRFFMDKNHPEEMPLDRIRRLRGSTGLGPQRLTNPATAADWQAPSHTDSALNKAEKLILNKDRLEGR